MICIGARVDGVVGASGVDAILGATGATIGFGVALGVAASGGEATGAVALASAADVMAFGATARERRIAWCVGA